MHQFFLKKKQRYSINISQLPNVYATHYLFKKLIHLLKVKGKFVNFLKPKSYLRRLEDIAHANQRNIYRFPDFVKSF